MANKYIQNTKKDLKETRERYEDLSEEEKDKTRKKA